MLTKIWKTLLVVLLFLLPWQTRWIYGPVLVNGNFWEYGSSALYGTEILLWIIIIVFLVDRLKKSNWVHVTSKVHWVAHRNSLLVVVGFFAFLILSMLTSIKISLSFDYLFRILEGLFIALIIASWGLNKKELLISFWAGGVVQGILALYQFFVQEVAGSKWMGMSAQAPMNLGPSVVEYTYNGQLYRWLRAYGSFSSPNILGGYLAIVFIIGLILYFWATKKTKFIYLLGQLFILMGLLLAFSRAAWLAAAIGWAGFGVYVWLEKENRRRAIYLYLEQTVFYVIISAIIIFMFSQVFAARFNLNNRLERRSVDERTQLLSEAVTLWKAHPILGSGPGTYTAEVFQKQPKISTFDNQPVHNSFMLILVEWGTVGLAIWMLVVAWLLVKVRRYNPIFLPLVVAMLVAAAFDHFWWSMYTGILMWWVVFGLSLNIELY